MVDVSFDGKFTSKMFSLFNEKGHEIEDYNSHYTSVVSSSSVCATKEVNRKLKDTKKIHVAI